MSILPALITKNKIGFIATFVFLLLLAFFQCYKSAHDLNWTCDVDFDRDMGFAQGALEGHYGKDPNYKGEYLWYNPLLFLTEALIAKTTGLPLNLILSRGGIYLNLLGPIAFVSMMLILFDFRIAAAGLLSYLFLASGNIISWGSATYSPWLYPVCFMQFIFYLNIILCYKAFSTQKYFWFFILGAFIGLSFLGHTAPTILIILIMIPIQFGNLIKAVNEKKYSSLKKYVFQGIATLISFVIVSLPLLIFIIGKYKLNMVNRMSFELSGGIFLWFNFPEMLKENISISFIISIIGFIWFYKNFHHSVIRKIILNWFFIVVIFYIYSSLIPVFSNAFHIYLPGTVPAFHYFFYFKAAQSVFFGFGLIVLLRPLINRVVNFFQGKFNEIQMRTIPDNFIIIVIIVSSVIYFPFYRNREDFVHLREQAISRQNNKGKIQVYNFIIKNISSDKVILCEPDASIFPVMATARKMVSINSTFSNPFLDFGKRETDRSNMLSYLKTGLPASQKKLFNDYEVSYVLLPNKNLENYKMILLMFNEIIFKNETYTLFQK